MSKRVESYDKIDHQDIYIFLSPLIHNNYTQDHITNSVIIETYDQLQI